MTDPMPRTGGRFTNRVYGPTETPVADLELVTKAYVDSVAGGGGSSPVYESEVPSGSVNGSNTAFTLSDTPTSGSLMLFLGGALQKEGSDYTLSGTTITFSFAPESATVIYAFYRTSDGSTSFADAETPTGSVNGSNTAFTLANTPVSGSLMLFLGGSVQTKDVDYSLSGTSITFTSAPYSGAVLIAWYRY